MADWKLALISFVVPAHNEALLIDKSLSAIAEATATLGEPYEIVVVDDASTDATSAIAERHGARVLSVNHHQIAATRNSGARAARGDVFFFVDADTFPAADCVRAGLAALREGAAGGGCVMRFDCPLPWWGWVLYPIGVVAGRIFEIVGGCFLFCTRTAFEGAGGFDEQYFAGEEIDFIRRLKQQGRFVVLREKVLTSGRKLPRLGAWKSFKMLAEFALYGLRPYRQREGLDLWYGPRE